MKRYIVLDGGKVVECIELLRWAEWYERSAFLTFESGGRRVALAELDNGKNVSTVFLGLDHSWNSPQPVLFETMVYNRHTGNFSQYQERYCTVEESRVGHAEAVRLASGEVEDTDGITECG